MDRENSSFWSLLSERAIFGGYLILCVPLNATTFVTEYEHEYDEH